MTCPSCQQPMQTTDRMTVEIAQCEGCHGIFLARASLGDLVEAENDWHAGHGQHTQPLPRITSEMSAPPASSAGLRKRSFVDALFG